MLDQILLCLVFTVFVLAYFEYRLKTFQAGTKRQRKPRKSNVKKPVLGKPVGGQLSNQELRRG